MSEEATQRYDNKRAAITGFIPELLDLSAFPGVTPEKIRAGLEMHADKLRAIGVDARIYLFDPADKSSTAEMVAALQAEHFDVVEIGAGVRTIPQFLLYFEYLVNLLRTTTPKTAICFNTKPDDTAEAIIRWL